MDKGKFVAGGLGTFATLVSVGAMEFGKKGGLDAIAHALQHPKNWVRAGQEVATGAQEVQRQMGVNPFASCTELQNIRDCFMGAENSLNNLDNLPAYLNYLLHSIPSSIMGTINQIANGNMEVLQSTIGNGLLLVLLLFVTTKIGSSLFSK